MMPGPGGGSWRRDREGFFDKSRRILHDHDRPANGVAVTGILERVPGRRHRPRRCMIVETLSVKSRYFLDDHEVLLLWSMDRCGEPTRPGQ
jgi:hypothetical protein